MSVAGVEEENTAINLKYKKINCIARKKKIDINLME